MSSACWRDDRAPLFQALVWTCPFFCYFSWATTEQWALCKWVHQSVYSMELGTVITQREACTLSLPLQGRKKHLWCLGLYFLTVFAVFVCQRWVVCFLFEKWTSFVLCVFLHKKKKKTFSYDGLDTILMVHLLNIQELKVKGPNTSYCQRVITSTQSWPIHLFFL